MLSMFTIYMLPIAVTLHILSAVVWVGGMFFAHFALRPVATGLLEPLLRLPFMSQVLERFFPWVWMAIVLLWTTGLWLIFWFHGGMGNTAIYIHIMLTIGLVMTAVFGYIFWVPFSGLKQAVTENDIKAAANYLAIIRQLIHLNLWLGLITIIVAAAGRFI
jgi:uncharacterized membrane protein